MLFFIYFILQESMRQNILDTYYMTRVPNNAWLDSRQQFNGFAPEISSNYGVPSRGVLYPWDKPYTNNCTLLDGCFRADPVSKSGLRVCGRSCDNPDAIDSIRYMFGNKRT